MYIIFFFFLQIYSLSFYAFIRVLLDTITIFQIKREQKYYTKFNIYFVVVIMTGVLSMDLKLFFSFFFYFFFLLRFLFLEVNRKRRNKNGERFFLSSQHQMLLINLSETSGLMVFLSILCNFLFNA